MKRNRGLYALLVALAVLLSASIASAETINVWGWEYTEQALGAVMDDFRAAHPDIEVNFRVLAPADLYQNLLLAISSGQGAPDVVAIENSHLAQYVETGGLADITEWAEPLIDDFNDYKWVDATYEGRIYAIPWDSGPVAIYYRRDIFAEAGLPSEPNEVAALLDTWEDFYETAVTIKEKTGAYMFSFSRANNDARIFENLMHQRQTGYFGEDGSVVLDNEKSVEILKYLGRFVWEDLVQDTEPWTAGWYAGIAEGQVATIIGAVWMGGFMKDWIAPDTSGKWGVVPLPVWEETDVRASNDGGSTLAIPAQSRKKEAARKYIEFMLARPESQLTMFKALDAFPSLETVYDDPIFTAADEYFGGQAHRQVFVQAVKEIPAWYYTADYAEANSIMANHLNLFLSGRKTAEKAIEDAANEIRRRTRRP